MPHIYKKLEDLSNKEILSALIYYGQGGEDAIKQLENLNPEYAEWLLGFPVGWTDLTPKDLHSQEMPDRIAVGISNQGDRLRLLGKTVDPQISEAVSRYISEGK